MKSLEYGLVSIITPSYNSSKYIYDTIQSVISQTYVNWEMIIVDDFSTDNSILIIQNILEIDSRIKLIKLKKNVGPAIARNKAIEIASGRYIAFLDSDDLWHKDKLEKQLKFMNQKGVYFTFSSYNVIDKNSEKIGLFEVKNSVDYYDLLKTNSIGCLTAMYDTKVLGKVFMPIISKRQDLGLWLKILKLLGQAQGIAEPLASYRILDKSVSSNKIDSALYQWKIYRDIEKLGFFRSIFYFIHYVYYGWKKYR
jgi:teichuronic acid biosynthesis glycosyltransferase TuaG